MSVFKKQWEHSFSKTFKIQILIILGFQNRKVIKIEEIITSKQIADS
jgi:hypothetical protein